MENKKVLSGFVWRFLERIGAHGVSFVVSIVLARLLDPVVYGTVALVTVLTALLQTFIDSGFGNALIQKKDADDLDFSSVFYFNIFIGIVAYIGLFFAAPFIAEFYEIPTLTEIVRVQGLILIIAGVKNVQQAYISRRMEFKKFFWATLIGTLISAAVGLAMALNGFGVWALVAQGLVNPLIDTIVLWMVVKWRPKLIFSFSRLKTLFSYGWKLLAVGLIDKLYNNARQLIIGKMNTEDLAFYNKGKQFPNLIIDNTIASIDSVLLPAMSKEQDRVDRVKNMTRRSIKTGTYLLAPMMLGFAACGIPIVRILLTEKWLPCIPFMTVFCITYIFHPIFTSNYNAYKALGRTDVYLKINTIQKAIGCVVLLCTMWFGVMAMTYSMLFTSAINQLITTHPNKKLLGYGYREQLGDILPTLLLAGFMGVTVYLVTLLRLNDFVTLAIQVPLGVAIYIAGSKLLKIDSFDYILSIVKGLFKKNENKTNS